MATLHDTAYPRLSKQIPLSKLKKLYQPTNRERRWLDSLSYSDSSKLEAAILLKCFQRLGYFPSRSEIPVRLVTYIAESLFVKQQVDITLSQRHSRRIKDRIRKHLFVTR